MATPPTPPFPPPPPHFPDPLRIRLSHLTPNLASLEANPISPQLAFRGAITQSIAL